MTAVSGTRVPTRGPEPGFRAAPRPIWARNMNARQLEAIEHQEGPCRLLAQAGSGKTRVLVHRAVRLVEEGVDPDRIGLFTFSRKAADEMAARCRVLGVAAQCRTWHSFCGQVLRDDQTRYARWTVDEKDRAKTIVKKVLGHDMEDWKGADLGKVRRFIGLCKANFWDHDSPEARDLAARQFGANAARAVRVMMMSQRLIEEACLLTFDDMLVFTARHLAEEGYRAAWAARFDYVMTDEKQDDNRVQDVLTEQLARDHRNLLVVGDLAQSIYGFRGSDPRLLAGFPERWGGRQITMNQNYRSGRRIVAVANEIIRPAQLRVDEDMVAERDLEGHVEVVACESLEDEASEVVSMVQTEREAGRKLQDVTVLFRTNAQSRALEEAFLRARIPYVIIGGVNFYERKEVKDLLGYLRVAAGRDDRNGDAFRRCINAPFRFLGAKFVERCREIAARAQAAAGGRGERVDWDAVVQEAAGSSGLQEHQRRRYQNSADEWCAIIAEVRACIESVEDDADNEGFDRPANVLDRLVRRTQYVQWLEKDDGEESIEQSHAANVRELLRVAQQFDTVVALLDYVEQNVRESERQRRSKTGDLVTLMSIHRAKGLEWPVVWVVGMNESVLPYAKGDPEEERRLAYVAATRARDSLYMSHVAEFVSRQGVKPGAPSRFLLGLPECVAQRASRGPDFPFTEEAEPPQQDFFQKAGEQ